MAAFTPFLQSDELFDTWSKEQTFDSTGTELDAPPQEVPEVLIDRSSHASLP